MKNQAEVDRQYHYSWKTLKEPKDLVNSSMTSVPTGWSFLVPVYTGQNPGLPYQASGLSLER